MSVPAPLRFDPSMRSFPTFRGLARALLAAVTLGRSGAVDRVRETVERSGLPGPLQDVVLRTARATRLWASERCDVARELASHFREGLDAGAEPGALAADFGDPLVSARLIRRAARRKRPWAWRAWMGLWKGMGLLLLSLVVIYLLSAAWYFTGSPTIKRNFFNEYNDAVRMTPPEQRAWPEYRRALMAMPSWPNETVMGEWPMITPDDPEYVNAVAFIRACAPQLDIVRAASRRQRLGYELIRGMDEEFEVRMAERVNRGSEGVRAVHESAALMPIEENPEAIGILLPHLGRLRGLARDLMFDAAVARHDGDGARVAADIEALLGLAHQTGQEGTLIGQLVGVAIMGVATTEVRRTLTETPELLTDGQLTSIAHRMATCIRPGTLTPDLASERCFVEDLAQRAYTDDGHGDGRLTDEGMDVIMRWSGYAGVGVPPQTKLQRSAQHAIGPVAVQVLAGRKELMREYHRVLDMTVTDVSRPPWQRMADSHRDAFEKLTGDTVWSARYLPVKLLVPAIGKVYWSGQRASFEREAAGVAIACEMHRRRSGAWPASLDEVSPQLLPGVPLDPFTGKPVLYRVVNGTPVIYSTGNDQDDDGGEARLVAGNVPAVTSLDIKTDADWVVWPLP